MSGYPIIPEYDILEEVGAGGMGTVYRALHKTLKRVRAIKLLQDSAHARRFEAEVRSLAELEDHPGIVSIYEVNLGWSPPYFAMAFLDGPTLWQLINQEAVPWERASRILAQVADALDYAHAHGIVHRDVKPGNIIVCSSTTGDRAVLTDFGIAKHRDFNLTNAGAEIGSTHYISPEVEAGQEATPKSDIYALGVIAHQLLVGKLPPFGGDPPNPASYNRQVSAKQGAVLQKAMAKDPRLRHGSAADFIKELTSVITEPPTGNSRTLTALLAIVVLAAVVLGLTQSGAIGFSGSSTGVVKRPQGDPSGASSGLGGVTDPGEQKASEPPPPPEIGDEIKYVTAQLKAARESTVIGEYVEARGFLESVRDTSLRIRSTRPDYGAYWSGLYELNRGVLAMEQHANKIALESFGRAFEAIQSALNATVDEKLRATAEGALKGFRLQLSYYERKGRESGETNLAESALNLGKRIDLALKATQDGGVGK